MLFLLTQLNSLLSYCHDNFICVPVSHAHKDTHVNTGEFTSEQKTHFGKYDF